jgi:beta-ureidopropionase / N-carbamoyl-L-amino-acid hydrolase
MTRDALAAMLAQLEPIGRSSETGGYWRLAWSDEDLACRAWFISQADARQMPVETDQNGNLWAWYPASGDGAVATGSHLDSVRGGGAFDGPLGVVSAFLAIDALRSDPAWSPERPIAVVDFADEEGARFGVACVGSRLLTSVLDPERARQLTDREGVTLAAALDKAGVDAGGLGPEEDRLQKLSCFVELHVEQGRVLAPLGAPLGLATEIWPHGRWRFELTGAADHAGTTRLDDRHDPALVAAAMVQAARRSAATEGGVATVGRVEVVPNSTNSVPAAVSSWLDARAPDGASLQRIVGRVKVDVARAARDEGVSVWVNLESHTPAVQFDAQLRERIDQVLGGVPAIPTGAGHDAGILASRVPTAMIFVRNPTGVSHSPAEHADLDDCAAGVRALTQVLRELAG